MVTAANVVPPMLAAQTSMVYSVPKNVEDDGENCALPGNGGTYLHQPDDNPQPRPELTPERCSRLFESLNLDSL